MYTKLTNFRILSGARPNTRIAGIRHFLRGRMSTQTNQFAKEIEMNSDGHKAKRSGLSSQITPERIN